MFLGRRQRSLLSVMRVILVYNVSVNFSLESFFKVCWPSCGVCISLQVSSLFGSCARRARSPARSLANGELSELREVWRSRSSLRSRLVPEINFARGSSRELACWLFVLPLRRNVVHVVVKKELKNGKPNVVYREGMKKGRKREQLPGEFSLV